MAKEQTNTKQVKTVKVSTLLIALAVVVAVLVAFVSGWVARGMDQDRITSAAHSLVQQTATKK